MRINVPRIVRVLAILSPLAYPAYLIHFKVAGVPFTALEVFTYLLFGLWLLAVARGQMPLLWDKTIRRFWWVAFAFLVAATISLLVSPASLLSLDQHVVAARQIAMGVWKGWIVA